MGFLLFSAQHSNSASYNPGEDIQIFPQCISSVSFSVHWSYLVQHEYLAKTNISMDTAPAHLDLQMYAFIFTIEIHF